MIAGAELFPVITTTSTNPANEVARVLTGRDYLSWSAISTFRTCPLKYWFRYVAGMPEESASSALVFGTGIHAAIQFGSTETRASLDALAAKMLTAFLNSPAASVQGRVLGVEEEIRGTLVEGVPDLYGRIDLVTEDEDRLVLTDFKTSRAKWSPEQAEDAGEQLLLYSKLAGDLAPGKKLVTRFLVLTKTKDPVIEEHLGEVRPDRVARTVTSVERVWKAIASENFYPAPSVVGCASCGYRKACEGWRG